MKTDRRLQADVLANVLAEVNNGYVTLTGEVDHPYQKQIAEHRIGELDGVIAVTNDVRPTPSVSSSKRRCRLRRASRKSRTGCASAEAAH